MNEILAQLAKAAGIDAEMAKKALATILAAIKAKIPTDSFAKLAESIPDAESLATEGSAGSGGLGALLGKLLGGGGGDMAAVIGKLGSLGISPDQVGKFLSSFLGILKTKLSPEMLSQISGLLPLPQEKADE
ncbi:MAG: DUF2780 domain-containing protein [Gemmataceae bacterium]